jgi:hypothetical protein
VVNLEARANKPVKKEKSSWPGNLALQVKRRPTEARRFSSGTYSSMSKTNWALKIQTAQYGFRPSQTIPKRSRRHRISVSARDYPVVCTARDDLGHGLG